MNTPDRYSTPIKTLHLNLVGMLNLSIEVWRGSGAELESTQDSILTFESDEEEAFVVEKQNESESDNEEPDYMPELAPALYKKNQEYETPPPSRNWRS